MCFVLLAFYPNLYFDMISPLMYCIYSLRLGRELIITAVVTHSTLSKKETFGTVPDCPS